MIFIIILLLALLIISETLPYLKFSTASSVWEWCYRTLRAWWWNRQNR